MFRVGWELAASDHFAAICMAYPDPSFLHIRHGPHFLRQLSLRRVPIG
jgi:hypothetical protein